MHDPGFRIFMGRYYDRVKNRYPHVVDLPASQIPEDMMAYTVRHQFWRGKQQWPVTQIGPGILTVNETEGYLWNSFRPHLTDAIRALFDLYPSEIRRLVPSQVTLKYIDAVAFDPAQSKIPMLRFLRESLHTSVGVEPLLFENPKDADAPLGLNLSLTFNSNKPKGAVILTIANGTREDTPSIIWETNVIARGEGVPTSLDEFETWLEHAHATTDRWFFTLTRGELLKEFEAKSNANH